MATPFEVLEKQKRLQQQEKLLQAMLAQGGQAQQGQMVSGRYVAPSALAHLNPLISALAGVSLDKRMGKEQQQLAGDYRTSVSDTYTRAMQNPNYAAGTAEMLNSGSPELQKLAEQRAKITEALIKDKQLDPTGRVNAAMSGDMSGLAPAAQYQSVNGQLIETAKGAAPQVAFDARDRFGEPVQVGKDFVQFNPETGAGKRLSSNSTNVGVNVQGFEPTYLKERGKGVAGLGNSLLTSAAAAQGIKQSVGQLKELAAGGVFTGPTATPAMFLTNVAQTFGIPIDQQRLANSEAYRGEVAAQVMQQTQALGGGKGMSQEETRILQASLGGLENSPAGMQAALGIIENRANQHLAAYEKFRQDEQQAYPGHPMLDFDPSQLPVQAPVRAQPSGGAAPQTSPEVQNLLDKWAPQK